MAKYKAYPEYKDSGVEWLEEIPVHWDSKPLKFLCTCNDQVISDSTAKDYEIEYVDIGSVSSLHGITKTENMIFSKLPSRARRLVQDGDVIISTVRTYLEAIAPITNPPTNMVVSTGFAVIRPLSYLDKKFAAYCLRASGFIKEVVARSAGVSYPAINASDLIGIPIPSCALLEQSKIAEFLDHETAKIDKLIEKQQQLIEMLKEKRQAVISHAVTKGLNPDVPMKDSGVEWLGLISGGCSLTKLKYLVFLKTERLIDHNSQYVGLENISSGTGQFLTKDELNPEGASISFCCGDVLFGKLRPYLAKSWLAEFSGVCSSEFLVFNTRKLHPKFLNYYLLTNEFIKQVDSSTYGSKMPRANWDFIGHLPLPTWSYEESEAIATYLDSITDKLDNLLEKQYQQVRLLQERRTAIISAAVTGKIDVRNWETPNMQKVKEPQEIFA